MTFQGRIQNGVVVFDEPIPLVDGTPAKVDKTRTGEASPSSSLVTTLLELSGLVTEGLPSDLARNHDHYRHGQPKR